MNIKPLSAPMPAPSLPNTVPNASAQDAKARAIAMLTGGAQVDQNAVSPEESSAIRGQKRISEEVETPLEESEQPVVEASGEESASEEPKEDPVISERYAALAKREKALRDARMRQEQALKDREEALKAREAELSKPRQEPKADYSGYISKDLLKTNPLAALAEAQISYDDLTQRVLEAGTLDPRVERMLQQAEEKIARLQEQIDNQTKSQQERDEQQYASALRQIETDIKEMVTDDPSYELIKATGAESEVVARIKETFEKEGVLLTNEEAAQQIEDELLAEAERLAKLEKIQKRLKPVASKPVESAPAKIAADPQTKPRMNTLTNANSVPARQLSARERALAAFEGKLK